MCLLLSLFTACRQPPNLVDPEPVQAFKGVRLKLAIGDRITHPHLVRQMVKEWSIRTGAEVELLPGSWDGIAPADFVILQSVDLPRHVVAKKVIPLPDSYRSGRHPYKWNDLSFSITDRIASWDARPYGLPIFNEGRVLVYRTDRWSEFSTAKKLTGTSPETWEELCDFAEFFNKPFQSASLPPLSKRPDDLTNEFHRIAANYDRTAISETNLGPAPKTPEQREAFFSFDFSTETAEPRINSPAFVHAAKLLKRMQACRPPEPSDDPLQAFRDGKAVVCVASLELLAQLGQPGNPLAGRFGIAPLPGSRTVFEKGNPVALDSINRVSYLGEGVWLGAVTVECKNPEAAWDFFVEFANPNTTSLDFIAAGKWSGTGFRGSHFDAGNRNNWFGYGLDIVQTERLIDIQRQNEAISLANPTLALRLPDREAYLAVLRKELDQILQGKVDPQAALDEVAKRWRERKLDSVVYRISLGL